MKKFLRILAWIFSVLVFLSGVGSATMSQWVPAVMMVLVAATAFPPLWDELAKRKVSVPNWARWIAALGLLVVYGATVPKQPALPDTGPFEASASPTALPKTVKPADQGEFSKDEKTAQAQALVTQVIDAAASCDSYGKAAAEAAEKADLYALYEATDAGQRACYTAAGTIRNLSPPDYVTKDGKKKLALALDQMGEAYIQKGYYFSRMKKVANGDTRPSAVSEAKQAGEGLEGMVLVAFAGIYTVLQEEGADGEKLMDIGK